MSFVLNQRVGLRADAKKRVSILVGFPDERFEAIVLQWEGLLPTVFLQCKYDAHEPLQFPQKRPQVPGNQELDPGQTPQFQGQVSGFLDPTTGLLFEKEWHQADFLISYRAFEMIRPEPDLVLTAQSIWEFRSAILEELNIPDEPRVLLPGSASGFEN